MNHLSEEQLILYYYRESDDEREIEHHLDSCPACRAQYQDLQQVLGAVNTFPVPERSAAYGSEVWKRLRPALPHRRQLSPLSWAASMLHTRWALAGAMAMLVVVAFMLGRYWPASRDLTGPRRLTEEQIHSRLLVASVADHFDRSRMVLVEILNAPDEDGEVDISAGQSGVRELVAANRLLRQTAERNRDSGLASVLDDLERVLLEIEHSPSQLSLQEIEGLRERVETQGILFKIRILESQIRQRQREAAREMARRIS